MRNRLLVVINEQRLRSHLCRYLSIRGYDVSTASGGGKAARLLDAKPFDLVIVDLHLPDMDGEVLANHIRRIAPTTLIMAISESVELLEILELLRNGVCGYLAKPFKFSVLEHRVCHALNSRYRLFRQIGERLEYQREHDGYDLLINREYLTDSFPTLEDIHRANKCVLISGEEGSGKRMLAHFLHMSYESAHAKLIRLNAMGLTYEQLQANLEILHIDSTKSRCFPGPRQATLLLENLQILPEELERFLCQLTLDEDASSCEKMSGCWGRVIITTMQQEKCMDQNDARFHSSKIFSMIHLKPLRERMEDLPFIADYLLAQSRNTYFKPVLGLETDAMHCLLAHSWPGNIEELRLALEQGVKSCKTKHIGLLDLPIYLQKSQLTPTGGSLLH
ncbi:MAG: response regulator [Candidatus Thiodiazotropha sp. (ex Semelilucina semeliformis)]|nr:response regulator [Candidatus Thiodiazotropha sp. (ex Semelilucina semeliformis)]